MPRILGIDYGEKRIGVAVSDGSAMLASSLCTVHVTGLNQAIREIVQICRELVPIPEVIVVGLPLNMDGQRGPICAKVEHFVSALQAASTIPIRMWDERLTSSQVERVLLDADISRAKRIAVRDKLAAQIMLQNYLDTQPGNAMDDLEND